MPKSNVEFWQAKVARNIERDLKSAQILDTLAWTVITVWECEQTKKNREATINRIEAELNEQLGFTVHFRRISEEND